jgi:hypothetical protein
MCFVEAKAVIRMPRHRRSLANGGGPAVGELVPNMVRLVPLLRPADSLSASAAKSHDSDPYNNTPLTLCEHPPILLSTRAAKRQGNPERLNVSLDSPNICMAGHR